MKNFGGIKTRYLLDGTNIIAQEVTNGDSLDYIYFFYDASGSPVGMNYLGNNYFYKKNLQGDIIEIRGTDDGTSDTSFRCLVKYVYDAWGNILQMNDTTDGWFKVGTANPFRYRGYYYDNESGFYYLQSRYYDPVTGRWLNPEPNAFYGEFDEGAKLLKGNLYAYCANSTIIYKDDTGEGLILACVLIGAGIGLLLGAGHGAASSYKKTGRVSWKETLKWAFIGGAVGAIIGYTFGVAFSAAGTGGSISLSRQVAKLSKQASKLTYSNTIKKHFATRAYYGSTQLLQQIMKAAQPIKDASLKNGLKWVVPGSMSGNKIGTTIYGCWELVIDVAKNQIVHWLFRPYK